MITPQLISFVRAQFAAGVSPSAVEQSLAARGWSAQDISEAFAIASPKAPAAQAIALPQLTGRKVILSLSFFIVSFVYALWQHSGGSQSIAGTTAPSAPGQASAAAVTPGQSYKAANDALLQTLAQLTTTSSTPPPTNQSAAAATSQKSAAATTPPVKTPASTPQPAQTPAAAPAPAPAPKKPAGMYADGSYTGSPVDAYYGTVQVKAIIKGGLLADVQFLQYPSDRSTSQYINSQAMPLLTQEAIKAQSAQVDGVSGATFTSQAFQQSLAVALASAKN